MLLKSFRIKNFRSIIDTGNCYVSPEITILAGKNESGKTNILISLKKFNKDEKFDDSDLPLYKTNNEPTEINFAFEVCSSEINNILKDLKIDIKVKKEKYTLNITKSSEKYEYMLSGELLDSIEEELQKINKKIINDANRRAKEVYALFSKYNVKFSENMSFSNTQPYVDKINFLINGIVQNQNIVTDKNDKEILSLIKNEMIELKSKIDIKSTIESINRKIISLIPKIILFSTFEDILPYEVGLNEAQRKKIITDFSKISGLDINELSKTSDTQKRKNIVNKASATIDGDFKSFWDQNQIDLKVDIDGSKLVFLIHDEGKYTPFRLEQRSKGLQWFLSFYITLNAESKEEGNIILIDEPGLYLHAKAQEDVLKVLEKNSKKNQIIFTTHMPYLIDPNKLPRVRLVLKNEQENETKIENKIYKGEDIEALTPIITAIGLDLSKGIGAPKENNVILEGISDYYYIQAMLTYLDYKLKRDIYFIPSFGADKIPLLIPLFRGWELNYLALFDHDRKGIRVSEKLKRNNIPQNNILFVSESENHCMEDLFSKKDFLKYVIKEKIESNELLNLKLINKLGFNKVILSKNFFDNITNSTERIQLSEETKNNFKNLFKKLDLAFSDDED